jgi:hypothetical protein
VVAGEIPCQQREDGDGGGSKKREKRSRKSQQQAGEEAESLQRKSEDLSTSGTFAL